MAQLFGKNYQETGKSSSPLLLRSNGEIKLQWGNKFIDLIKNGKLNSQSDNILFTVSTKNDINKDGIYLVTEDNSIWFSLNGTILQLSNTDSDTTYISYMVEQKTTAEQKYQALTNIGFYYKTLEEAQQANLTAGIIFNQADNKFYIIKEGTITEYQNSSSSENLSNLDELYIEDMHIYKDGTMKINSTELTFYIENNQTMTLQNSNILLNSRTTLYKGLYSVTYKQNQSGYGLYETDSKSILEVDSIKWRNIENELPTLESTIDEIYDYNESNVITSCKYYENNIKGFLKYPNQYKVGDYIFIALNVDYYTYVVTITTSDEEDGNQTLSINQTVPSDHILTLTDVNGVKYSFSGSNTSITGKFNDFESGIMYYNDIEQPEFKIVFGNNSNPKKQLIEFKVLNINQMENSIIFDANNESVKNFIIDKCYSSRVALSRPSSLYIENNAITLKERTEKKKNELTDETTISNITHTKIGEVSEKQFEKQLNSENPSQYITNQERPNVGIYSDNLIGLNPILYNSIFKGSYPKYTGNIPEKPLDQTNDQNLLNLKWFKQLYNQLIPIGTIIMFNSIQNIPDGWHICDGTNGTPNLIGKFIKAGTLLETNETDLDQNNYLTINQENLPDHSHGSLFSEQEFLTSAYLTKGSSEVSGTFYSATEGTKIKVQTSYDTLNINNSKVTFDNTPIKVEPNAYSLIFIMKYKDLD